MAIFIHRFELFWLSKTVRNPSTCSHFYLSPVVTNINVYKICDLNCCTFPQWPHSVPEFNYRLINEIYEVVRTSGSSLETSWSFISSFRAFLDVYILDVFYFILDCLLSHYTDLCRELCCWLVTLTDRSFLVSWYGGQSKTFQTLHVNKKIYRGLWQVIWQEQVCAHCNGFLCRAVTR